MLYIFFQKIFGEIVFCILFLTLLGMRKRIFSFHTILFMFFDLSITLLIRSIVPMGIHIGILMIISIIVATSIYKSDIIYTALCMFITTFFYFIVEFLLSLIFMGFGISIADISQNQSILLTFNSITTICMSVIALIAYKFDFQIHKKVFLSKRLNILLSFIFAAAIILGLQFYFIGTHIQPINIPLYSLLILLFIMILFIIYELVRYTLEMSTKDKEYHEQQVYLEYIHELVDYLRGQRHEFVNHINVLYGLVQIDDISRLRKAKEYIEQMDIKVHSDKNVLTIGEPIISGLLCTKLAIAEQKNIHIDLVISDDLEKIPLTSPETSIILGNLIDNAIDFTESLPNAEKSIAISILGSEEQIEIIVKNRNNGQILMDRKKIFEKGYTTKCHDQDVHGFGLYNVKQIIQKYEGIIEVHSNRVETKFKVIIPKSL